MVGRLWRREEQGLEFGEKGVVSGERRLLSSFKK
jgi:hypothetical protein